MSSELSYRFLSLFVENRLGVLAKISSLLAGKAYNIETLTVGTTEDITISRMTIGLRCSDETFEQIKKQLNRSVDIIRVLDFTEADVVKQELLLLKVMECDKTMMGDIVKTAQKFRARVAGKGSDSILLEVVAQEEENNELISAMRKYPKIEVVRGGVVAIEKCGQGKKKESVEIDD